MSAKCAHCLEDKLDDSVLDYLGDLGHTVSKDWAHWSIGGKEESPNIYSGMSVKYATMAHGTGVLEMLLLLAGTRMRVK